MMKPRLADDQTKSRARQNPSVAPDRAISLLRRRSILHASPILRQCLHSGDCPATSFTGCTVHEQPETLSSNPLSSVRNQFSELFHWSIKTDRAAACYFPLATSRQQQFVRSAGDERRFTKHKEETSRMSTAPIPALAMKVRKVTSQFQYSFMAFALVSVCFLPASAQDLHSHPTTTQSETQDQQSRQSAL